MINITGLEPTAEGLQALIRVCKCTAKGLQAVTRAYERTAEGLQALIRACERTAKGLQAAIMPGIYTGRDSNEATDLSVGILTGAALQTF